MRVGNRMLPLLMRTLAIFRIKRERENSKPWECCNGKDC